MAASGRDDDRRNSLSLTMRLVRAVDAVDPVDEALRAVCDILGAERASYYTRNPVDRTLSMTHASMRAMLESAVASRHHEDDTSIAAQTLQLRQPVIRAPFHASPLEERLMQAWGLSPMRNIASLPILVRDTPVGVLQLGNLPPAVFSAETIPLADVAALFGAVLEGAGRRYELATLGDTIVQVNRSLALHETFDAVLDGLMTLVPSVTAGIYIDGIAPDALVLAAMHTAGSGERYPKTKPRPLDGSLAGWVYMHRTAVNIADVYDDPRALLAMPDDSASQTDIRRSCIMVPMIVQQASVGVLICSRRGIASFSAHDLEVVERFAPLAAQAVVNARLYEDAEQGRKQSETFIEDLADAVMRIGLDNRVIGWNKGAERVLGYTAAEMIGQYPPVEPLDNDPRYVGFYSRVLRGESFANIENRQRHKDGYWLDVLISLSPLRARGEIVGTLVFVRDITRLKMLQAQLQAEIAANQRRAKDEAYIASVARACNSAADGPAILQALASLTAFWADTATVVTFIGGVSKLAASATKTPEEDAAITADLQTYVNLLTGAVYQEGHFVITEPRVLDLREMSAKVPLIAAALARGYHTYAYAPIYAGDEIVGALGTKARGETPPFDAQSLETLRLVAEQAGLAITKDRLLKQVEAQVVALEQASRHKDDFLASLSHELRTPLNAILGFGQILADGLLTDPQEIWQAADDIVASGKLLLAQVNDLLDMARVEAGQMTMEWSDVSLPPLVQACERVLAPLVAAKGQQLQIHLAPDLPMVRADTERLRQVLLNLLTNAHKFTPEDGAITIVGERQGDQVVVAVQDTGIGIAAEHAALVFEPFRRVETGYARKQSGTGLGLALCRRLIELMGGTLTLESTLGVGSTFIMTLHIADAQARPLAVAADGRADRVAHLGASRLGATD